MNVILNFRFPIFCFNSLLTFFLEKYPEIRQLYGNDYAMLIMMPFIVGFQIWMCWMVGTASWPITFLASYVISGTINQSQMLAVHENSHNTVFGPKRQLFTRLFGMFINLPIGVPIYVSFKKYHGDHHTFLGHHAKDRDIPHPIEARMFNRPITKVSWKLKPTPLHPPPPPPPPTHPSLPLPLHHYKMTICEE